MPTPSNSTLTRKDIASALLLSTSTIGRREKALHLDTARISLSRRTVRYAESRLRRLDWWKKLTDD